MKEPPTIQNGRPRVPENKRKKQRTISLSDDEHDKLVALATAASQNVSEYVISQLKLTA